MLPILQLNVTASRKQFKCKKVQIHYRNSFGGHYGGIGALIKSISWAGLAIRKTEALGPYPGLMSPMIYTNDRGYFMSSRKKQNYRSFQSTKGGHFIALFDDMMESSAWELLTANDIMLYLYMLKKFKIKYVKGTVDKSNENNISMPRQEYIKLMHQSTFFKSIDRLIELGFIKVIESGYATHTCNIYGFNDAWRYYGTDAFKIKDDWKRPKSRMY